MHIVVVGSGVAGDTAAVTARSQASGAEVTIVSEERHPLYSACIFGHYLGGDVRRGELFLRTDEDYERMKIRRSEGALVLSGDGARRVLTLKDGEIAYDRLILATGSQAMVPGIAGCTQRGVFAVKSMADLDGLAAHLAGSAGARIGIVGSGPVGCELALRLASRGHRVYLVERLDRVMPRLLDGDLAAVVQRTLEGRGIEVYVDEEVTQLGGSGTVGSICTNRHDLPCEAVCLAVGMRPRTELARAMGVAIGKAGGIVVDDCMATNLDDVYACGDCVETPEVASGSARLSMLWHTAKWQGHVAGSNSVGVQRRYPGSLNFAIVDALSGWVGSSGHVREDFGAGQVEIRDQRTPDCWLRLFIAADRLAGFQFVGRSVPRSLGLLLRVMRTRVKLKELRGIQALSFAAELAYRPLQVVTGARKPL